MKSVLKLAGELAFSPEKAFSRMERPGWALKESILIFLVFSIASSVFFALRPANFPSGMGPVSFGGQGFVFWVKLGLFNLAATAFWVIILGGFLNLAREGWMPLRILLQVCLCVAAAVILVLFAKDRIPGWGFALLGGMFLGAMFFFAWLKPLPWPAIFSLMLAVNLFSLAAFLPMTAAVWLRSEGLYIGSQLLFLIWMLAVASKGLRRFLSSSLPRCFISIVLSMVLVMFGIFSLHLSGLLSPEMLKVYMVP